MIAQAAVFFTEASPKELQRFVETGELSSKGAVMPYNPAVMEGIAKAWGQTDG